LIKDRLQEDIDLTPWPDIRRVEIITDKVTKDVNFTWVAREPLRISTSSQRPLVSNIPH
jgi:hypothetical protein